MGTDDRKRILVTGANGFIGRSLCAVLKADGHTVRGAVRSALRDVDGVDEYVQVGDINGSTDWQQALTGIDAVIHLAARVHVMNETATDPLEAFRQVNVLGTERLARMAARAGVKRFIFLSSVKVNGEKCALYKESDVPAPQDGYGISKWEAEKVLAAMAAETGLELVILRPPLVYGPGVKANFQSLMTLVSTGLPLPFGRIRNKRSFVYVGNLSDAILTCLWHPKAAGETFFVSDGDDVSTPELMRMIARAMGKAPLLFSLPMDVFKVAGILLGKREVIGKLTGALCVDSGKIRDLLGWMPPFTLQEGIKQTVEAARLKA